MSLRLKLLFGITRVLHVSSRYKLTGKALLRETEIMQKHVAPPKKSLLKAFDVLQFEISNHTVFKIQNCSIDKILIYLPGGGFIQPILGFHWNMIEKLAKQTGYTIFVGEYPLTPKCNVDDALDFTQKLYDLVRRKYPSAQVIVAGDSAGGNLTLSFSQYTDRLPDKLICLSPLVDFTTNNPLIYEIEKHDTIVATTSLFEIAEWYRGKHDLSEPILSPINGNYPEEMNVLLISGTRDCTNPDTALMAKKFPHFEYIEYPGLPHVFPIFPIPEANDAIEKMIRFLVK
jgi:acetyl esterase/lipase